MPYLYEDLIQKKIQTLYINIYIRAKVLKIIKTICSNKKNSLTTITCSVFLFFSSLISIFFFMVAKMSITCNTWAEYFTVWHISMHLCCCGFQSMNATWVFWLFVARDDSQQLFLNFCLLYFHYFFFVYSLTLFLFKKKWWILNENFPSN